LSEIDLKELFEVKYFAYNKLSEIDLNEQSTLGMISRDGVNIELCDLLLYSS
jgi:hypothetical protein